MMTSQNKADIQEMNFAMRLSFTIGLILLVLKVYAYYLTGSTAILADAAEATIHISAIAFAVYSMWLTFKPADKNHLYGHDKIGYFSAGFEGAMIIIAAIFILYESITKLIYGFEIANVYEGLVYIILSIFVNTALGLYLINRGKKHHSIILDANGKHILADCGTSIAVIVALFLVKFTGITLFDPLVAIFAAFFILWTGSKLVKRSIVGLMDQSDPILNKKITSFLNLETEKRGLHFHHLRHRTAGSKVFIEFHLLFPKEITLEKAHEVATEIEANLKSYLEMPSDILTHLEPSKGHDKIHHKYGLMIEENYKKNLTKLNDW
jgi:cation diffusion facilitator family transporter